MYQRCTIHIYTTNKVSKYLRVLRVCTHGYIRDIFFFNTNTRFEIFFILRSNFRLYASIKLFIYIKHTILQFYPTSVLLLRPPIPGPALIELSLLLRLLLLSAFFNKYLLLKNFLKR